MLLRSSSSPILHSWPNSASEPDSLPQLLRTRSSTAETEEELPPDPVKIQDRREAVSFFLSSSGLGEATASAATEDHALPSERTLQETGDGGGGGVVRSRGSYGGGGRGRDDGPGPGRGISEAYYETMIDANPGNPLFLANYANYLKKVKADFTKAEQFYERATLANPADGNVLSHYADLLWQTHGDSARAEAYLIKLSKPTPTTDMSVLHCVYLLKLRRCQSCDSFVLASYARFLWDADDDEEEENDVEAAKASNNQYAAGSLTSPSEFIITESHWPPLAAAS
ncbi:hypothetical protein SASPL_128780 [Salvia splendens]|uniref:Uncharacterized protein n=1 Tax=Salvia splendens TaxID=180675 RepID=A0A8X8ZNV5_SALSN|nr:hypothetical protein SASPL_128780 [Salvia splendens]